MAAVKINVSALNNFLNRTVQPYLAKKAQEIADEAKQLAPQGATGDLRNSIHVERTAKGGVSVKVDSGHAGFVHQGTGPGHIPSPNPSYFPRVRKRGLILWADNRNINPYKAAAGIARNGTPANPFLEEAIQRVLSRSAAFRWITKDLSS